MYNLPEPVFFMNVFLKIITAGILLSSQSFSKLYGQDQNPANDLLQQSRALIQQNDFEKAKLTLNLVKKYVEKEPAKWLEAQAELLKISLAEYKTTIAENLLNEADKIIKDNGLQETRISQQILLLKSKYYRLINDFQNSNLILEGLISKFDDAEAETFYLNNLIDEKLNGE